MAHTNCLTADPEGLSKCDVHIVSGDETASALGVLFDRFKWNDVYGNGFTMVVAIYKVI